MIASMFIQDKFPQPASNTIYTVAKPLKISSQHRSNRPIEEFVYGLLMTHDGRPLNSCISCLKKAYYVSKDTVPTKFK
jgi:hypothetical protein